MAIWKHSGGLEAVNRDVALAFRTMGWRVKVLSVFGTDDEKDSREFDVASLCPNHPYFQYLWKRFFWKISVALIVRYYLAKGGLLVYGHAHLLPILDKLPENTIYEKWGWIYGIDVWGLQAIRWKDYLNQLDRVISISSYTANQVCAIGVNRQIRIIPCSVNTNIFVPTLTPERIRRNEILICGRMTFKEAYKGHQVLLESIPIAEQLLGHDVAVRVVGSGDDRMRLEKIAEDLGLSDRVFFTGRVTDAELVEAYQHCGVFCMPSYVEKRETGYWTGEGFGIVYVEAAACGRPVIASRDGGAPETIIPGETGLLVDPRSHDSVARAIADILSDSERADEMGRRGRILAEKAFTKENFIENVKHIIHEDDNEGC